MLCVLPRRRAYRLVEVLHYQDVLDSNEASISGDSCPLLWFIARRARRVSRTARGTQDSRKAETYA